MDASCCKLSSVPVSLRSAPAWPRSAWATCSASFLEGALRNPGAADGQQGRLFIGFAAAELLGLLAFVVAMIRPDRSGTQRRCGRDRDRGRRSRPGHRDPSCRRQGNQDRGRRRR
jgi:hypothetical protein